MDIITKLTNMDVAAFDQLLLAIRRLEGRGGAKVTPGDVRNLRVIAQNLIQTKLDSLQILERYEEFVLGRDAEAREYCKALEKDVRELRESSEERARRGAQIRKAANLEEELKLKNDECEYLRRVNAELQTVGGKSDREEELESLRSEMKRLKSDHAGELARLRETGSAQVQRVRDEYEGQIMELVSESREVELSEDREREAFQARLSEKDSQVEKLQDELSFLKTDVEVKGKLADKLRKENENLSEKYRQQSSRTRELQEELTTAHDQMEVDKRKGMEKLQDELSFLKADVEVKGKLADKLRKENENLSEKYRQQSSRTRELQEELTTAHDQMEVDKRNLMEEIETLMEQVREYSQREQKRPQEETGAGTRTVSHEASAAAEARAPASPVKVSPPPAEAAVSIDELVQGNGESAPLVEENENQHENEDEEEEASSSGEGEDMLQGRLQERNPGAKLLSPPSPPELPKPKQIPHSSIHTALENMQRGSGASTSGQQQQEEEEGQEHVEIFWDSKWWKARVNDRNMETQRMSVVFGPHGNELIQWVPFKSLRIRPLAAKEASEASPNSPGGEDPSDLTMDQFFLDRNSDGEEEEEEEASQTDGKPQKKKKKMRFKALRRFSSMGRSSLGSQSAQGKRNRFMSVA
ncbi:hypothetical protein HOP50_02g17630 [Chloropicon primus]|uniref:Uncharacterized protein n=2 Tax=Chloropicon primus TaxID=1764295 RepID=A0A5B8MF28_9CHLO|nr:hypothetical protein A3770_02p17660 [Chloropicon primus]UPQ98457.1 hypothetical protein HOP50_02g17630 [Chloropicon primus]|eukprot:QDZ19248.1 hypothetical protein A3770_02p17660 [Chloropicon primus]